MMASVRSLDRQLPVTCHITGKFTRFLIFPYSAQVRHKASTNTEHVFSDKMTVRVHMDTRLPLGTPL